MINLSEKRERGREAMLGWRGTKGWVSARDDDDIDILCLCRSCVMEGMRKRMAINLIPFINMKTSAISTYPCNLHYKN